ncbi:uncharacterized protein FIBRA_05411 [Fibroporia radiculosa]|uniref:Pentacotripeptide-repeat region of PRORP domain-containing protein n=1 Tax=Fibroporia radiculosa TaxID=599839 RepID=J4G9B6_9APHY|nr:uncharacterized protein FIBRA_05411 [Fibroporia radiculosa]CCM03283.1 predicted protein [Fibroporia radiculosa]
MAAWALRNAPWTFLFRARIGLESFAWPRSSAIASHFNNYVTNAHLPEETPSMAEMRERPYPTASIDSSIFENPEEYHFTGVPRTVPLPQTASQPVSIHPSLVLEHLVEQGMFLDADRVLAELKEMHAPIRPSELYVSAALNVLDSEHEDIRDRLDAFVRWYSLIPPAPILPWRLSNLLETRIFSDPVLDLSLMMQYALISASNGYANRISRRVLAFIFRFTPPSLSQSFLETLLQTAWTNVSLVARPQLEQRIRHWFSVAIESHCTSGRIADAVQILQAGRSKNYTINTSTYEILRNRLSSNLDVPRIALVDKLRESDNGAQHILRLGKSSLRAAASATRVDLPVPMHTPETNSLAMALRIVKNSWNGTYHVFPSALVTFITTYKASGRTIALPIIQKRACKSYPTASQWALAEMLYHFHRKEFHHLLVVFTRYFHVIGLPKRTKKYIGRTMRRLRGKSSTEQGFIVNFQEGLQQKMWPKHYHSALVWRAVSELTPEVESVEHLYQELLTQVSDAQNPDSTTARFATPLDGDPQAQAPITLYSSTHFSFFVNAFGKLHMPSRAAQVVADMCRLGIAPTVHTLTMLSSAFARVGDMEKLTSLLDHMESPSSQIGASSGMQFPLPNLVTYTAIIRCLMRTRRMDEALNIMMRMRSKTRYVPGENPVVDRLLQELARHYAAIRTRRVADNEASRDIQFNFFSSIHSLCRPMTTSWQNFMYPKTQSFCDISLVEKTSVEVPSYL